MQLSPVEVPAPSALSPSCLLLPPDHLQGSAFIQGQVSFPLSPLLSTCEVQLQDHKNPPLLSPPGLKQGRFSKWSRWTSSSSSNSNGKARTMFSILLFRFNQKLVCKKPVLGNSPPCQLASTTVQNMHMGTPAYTLRTTSLTSWVPSKCTKSHSLFQAGGIHRLSTGPSLQV